MQMTRNQSVRELDTRTHLKPLAQAVRLAFISTAAAASMPALAGPLTCPINTAVNVTGSDSIGDREVCAILSPSGSLNVAAPSGILTNQGLLDNSGSLSVEDGGVLTSTSEFNYGADAHLVNRAGGSLTNAGELNSLWESTLQNYGSMTNTVTGTLNLGEPYRGVRFINELDANFTNSGNVNSTSSYFYNSGSITNDGQVESTGSIIRNRDGGSIINNYNFVTYTGTEFFNALGATLTNASGALLSLYSGSGLNNNGAITNFGDMEVLSGSYFINDIDGTFTNSSGATFIQGDYRFGFLRNSGSTINENGAQMFVGNFYNEGDVSNSGRFSAYNFDNDPGAVFVNESGSYASLFSLQSSGEITNASGAELWIDNLNNVGQVSNAGEMNVLNKLDNSGILTNAGTLNNSAFGTLSNTGTLSNSNSLTNAGSLINLGTVTNSGSVSNTGTLMSEGTINNTGGIVNAGQLSLMSGLLNSSGSIENQGSFRVSTGASVNGYSGSYGSFTQIAGSTLIDGSLTQNTVNIQGGVLAGSGSVQAINAPVMVGAGAEVRPGDDLIGPPSIGTLTSLSDFVLGGTLYIDIFDPLSFDVLDVGGTMSFEDGSLVEFILGDMFTPTDDLMIEFLTADVLSGFEFFSFNLFGLVDGFGYDVFATAENDLNLQFFSLDPPVGVPEPGTLLLLATGLPLLRFFRRRRERAS